MGQERERPAVRGAEAPSRSEPRAGQGASMAVKLRELGTRRFIGDTERMIVHDRWNTSCEDCLLEELVAKGTARGFNPDESDEAFWEDYEYCPNCFDRSDPSPPAWARRGGEAARDQESESREGVLGEESVSSEAAVPERGSER